MKAKNQQTLTSETDAREKLIVYVYEYLIHSGAKQAADIFIDNLEYSKKIEINPDGPGFLHDWWCVFWDLYCAAPERRHGQSGPSNPADARGPMDPYIIRHKPMSPSIAPSPPQHPQQVSGPQFIGGPRYGPPGAQSRGPMPRMQGPMPPQHGGPPYPGAPPPPNSFMPTGSPRYAQHPGPPPPQQHMNHGMMFVPGPGPGSDPHQVGPSPGLNRMTPVGESPQGVVGPPPPNGPPPQMIAMSGQQIGGPPVQGPPPPPPSQMNPMQQANGPPRDGSQGPPGNVNYNAVNSPAHGPCYSGSGEPSTPHGSEEYVMPVPSFGQDHNDQSESAEIMKIKQSMQDDTTKMFEKEQSEYSIDYQDSQTKWT